MIAQQLIVATATITTPTIQPGDTLRSYQPSLTFPQPIPAHLQPTTAWIATMNGAGYAELIWSINAVSPHFGVSLFVANTTGVPRAAVDTVVTFVFLCHEVGSK